MIATPAWAGILEDTPSPVRKLGRGFANVATGVFEIIPQIGDTAAEAGPAAALSVGLLRGLGVAIARTAAGVVEILTFPIPLPQIGYLPLIEPEFLFSPYQN